MKKDPYRDYATDCFRLYAKYGTVEDYIERMLDTEKYKGIGDVNPTEATLIKRDMILREHAAVIADLQAVEMVFHALDYCHNGKYIRRSIEVVYMTDCCKPIKRGDIMDRVHNLEINIPTSTAQIFKWLKKARMNFAEERGLRV
jgi:hypothetical protein